MVKKRVFVSFDFDNDEALKHLIIGQARLDDSPFEVYDCSMKEAAPITFWEKEAEQRINRCDVVIVMVGKHTYRAPGVLKEVSMARRLQKPIFQIIGCKNGAYTSVPNAGQLYSWNWDNLKKLLGG